MGSKKDSSLLLFSLFLKFAEESIGEDFYRSFWCSFECLFSFDHHGEHQRDISMIDGYRDAWYFDGFDETNDIFEKFLVNTNNEVDLPDVRFLSEFIEFHSTITKTWIIVRISNFKFDRFSWVIYRAKFIDTLRRRTISTKVPIKRVDIIELKTVHLSCIKFHNKCCSGESSTSTKFITILIEEKDACWSFFSKNRIPCFTIFLDVVPYITHSFHIKVPL